MMIVLKVAMQEESPINTPMFLLDCLKNLRLLSRKKKYKRLKLIK
jgi:hypothetical protein